MLALKRKILWTTLLLTGFSVSVSHAATVKSSDNPVGNATWAYDGKYFDGPAGAPYNKAGLFLTYIENYNQGTTDPAHQINTVFSYGGSIEMYCKGSGESSPSDECKINFLNPDDPNDGNNMFVYYGVPFKAHPNQGDTGQQSTAAYKAGKTIKHVMPIVDGRLDSNVLSAFNSSPEATVLLADEVAQKYCADDNVDGVQVDLEPFNIEQPGQKAFYTELGKVFTSKNYGCVNANHPNGRYFSNFAFPGNWVNEKFEPYSPGDWQSIKDAFGANGFFIMSAYDVGPNSAGNANSPQQYDNYLRAELTALKQAADQYGINFMVGIPAAASTKEFESTATWTSKGNTNIHPSGYKQIDYLMVAEKAMQNIGIKTDPHYLGSVVWGWSTYMMYPPHTINLDLPNVPQPGEFGVLNYLKNNL